MTTSPEFTTTPTNPKIVFTCKQRRLQHVKLCIVAIVSIITVVLTCIDLAETIGIYEEKHRLKANIEKSIKTASFIHNLQKEREITILVWGLELWNANDHVEKLKKARKDTDESVLVLRETDIAGFNASTNIWNVDSFSTLLKNYRDKLDKQYEHMIHCKVTECVHTYSAWIKELISWLPQYTVSENLENYSNLVFAYQMIIQSKEEAGMETALGGLHFVQGKAFSMGNSIWYNEERIRAKNTLLISFSFSDEVKNMYHALIKEKNATAWMKQLDEKRQILSSRNISKPSKDNALEWFDLMTFYNNLMLELQLRDGRQIQDKVKNKLQKIIHSLVIRSLLLCFTLVVVPTIIISLMRVQNAFYKYTMSLFDTVGLEEARTEFLMLENARHVENLAERWKSFSNRGHLATASNQVDDSTMPAATLSK